MAEIGYFVPGEPGERGSTLHDDAILSRLRWPIPPGVIHAYVRAYTRPGDQVLLPFAQGAAEVRAVLEQDRRPIAIHYDPLLVLLTQAELFPIPAQELDAAITRLGDTLKQGTPLRRYIESLYATTCPACLRPAVADYFIWEQGLPVAKHLHCPGCEWEGQTVVERADLQPLAEIPPRGLHYHYILDRVAPQPEGNPLRARLEPLLELYTPRNLAALADLTRKIETLPEGPGGRLRRALWVLLLDCLDCCSVLAPMPGSETGRRGLTRPARFVERNVWLTFEETAHRVRSWADLAAADGSRSQDGEAELISQGPVRDLPRTITPHTLPLILVSPPPLDLAAWSLSYLWGAWLLGAEAAAPLRPLLRPRTPDPTWYARVMGGSFRALADLLSPEGRILVVLDGRRPAVLEALLWAASRAGLEAAALLQSGGDYRIELAPAAARAASIGSQAAQPPLNQVARQAIVDTIRARAEPTGWRTLHAAVQQRLSASGLLAQAAGHNGERSSELEAIAGQVRAAWKGPGLVRLDRPDGGDAADGDDDELWWLTRPGTADPSLAPLADRVEAAAYAILQESGEIEEGEFAARLYARFPGVLTPDAGLIAGCLRSYAVPVESGQWRLRPEDRMETRQAEQQQMVDLLLRLGERLGHRARASEPFDVAWLEGKRARSVFVVRWQAAVGEAAALAGKLRGARPYLVIPGGRAALTSYKLAHNPPLQHALDRAGWHFIKYRHVRQLAAEPEVDEYALRAIVGLDPIVEREAVQIPLF